jgi:CheY-like chemotaxis protein/HPt (histidine-containing phosphotransfer) domain-containing protein
MLGLEADRNLPIVLLIDDDMVSREVIATMLTMTGYTVHTAENGADSVAMLDDGTCTPDVILMDTQMPGLSGIALVRELRVRSKAVLYAVSASPPPDEILKGTDGFLLKPFGPEELQRALQKRATKPEPSPLADAPVLNTVTLGQLRSVMPESALREVFAAVTSDLENRHTLLETAINKRDSAEVKRLGHAIKGGCSMAGAQQASKLGQLLETRGDDLEYSRSLLPHLRVATENLKRMLEAEFSPKETDSAV